MHGPDIILGIPATDLTTTTMGIPKLSPYPDDYFNDWFGRFYLGQLAGTDFQVEDFDQQKTPALTDGIVEFKPAASTTVTTKDYFEMYPVFSAGEMDDAINLAIVSIEDDALQDKRDDSITVITSSTYEYSIPDGFVYISEVIMEQDTSGRFSDSLDTIDPIYWRILPGTPPKLLFDSNYVSLTAGRKLRLIGQQAAPELTSDADICSVDQAFVLYQAKANLHLAKIEESGDEHYRKMVVAQARAHEEREGIHVAGHGERVAF
jgi:hypothetical protein